MKHSEIDFRYTMTFSQYVHSMYDAKIEAVSFTQLQMQNRTDSTMQKQALCSRRYLVRTAAGACTLTYPLRAAA